MDIVKKIWIIFVVIALVLPLMAFGIVYYYQGNIEELPYFGQQNTLETVEPYYSVPDFEFISQEGTPVTEVFVKGKVWVGHYFFTSCPSICPKIVAALEDVQKYFRDDTGVRFISFTVDPQRDSFQQLKAYAAARNIDTRQWQFATGEKRSLYRFARNGLFIDATDGNGGPDDFIHSDKLVLVDRQCHIRGYYDGTDKADVKKLIKDIKRIK